MNLLGKISLAISLFCFLLTMGFKVALSGWIPFIGWGFGFGLFFLVFALVINIGFLKGLLKSESLHFVGKSLVLILLSAAILFVVNFIVFKQDLKVDITENKIHSLSKLSQALIKALPEDLNFYYFHVGNDKVIGYESKVREELKPFMDLNSRVHLYSHSVFQRPDLAKKFKTGNEESSLYVEYQDRIERVSTLTESSIINAVLKLTKKQKKIYFLTGHDERQIQDDSTFGLKGLRDQLQRLHFKLDQLQSLQNLPDDIAILAIVGPRKPFSDQEISDLQRYLDRDGVVLIAMDPGEDLSLNKLLVRFGLELTNHFVVSTQKQASQSEFLVLTYAGQAAHEIPNSMIPGENPVLFLSSSLKVYPEMDEMRVTSVLEHLPNNVARDDIAPGRPIVNKGQQTAAAISEGLGASHFRLAVVADSDFMTNQYYAQPGNFNFILSVLTYLSKDEDLLKMKPPVPKTTYLVMTETQLKMYFLFYILPFAFVFFIFALFFKLRRYF